MRTDMRLNSIIRNTLRRGACRLSILGVLCLAMGFSSCESIFDNEPNCRLGVALNFVFEYHMEPGANAFPANVDCVSVLVFDNNGNYIKHLDETSDALRNPEYRMELPLEVGQYHLVVYGGVTCDKAAFEFEPDWLTRAGNTKDDIRVTLPLDNDGQSKVQLHDIEQRTGGLFYGIHNVTITEHDYSETLREETVYLMKDTNNIQIILQELSSPYQIDYKDYDFRIVDDNFVLDGYNNPVYIATDTFQPEYAPYATYNQTMGYVELGREGTQVEEDEERPVQVACAEFSTSRLFIEHIATARLHVISRKVKDSNGENKVIIDLPLIKYLTAVRGFGDSWIKSDQEFLDRQSRWTMMFFLQHDVWVNARISVNWWTVRVNDIELDY